MSPPKETVYCIDCTFCIVYFYPRKLHIVTFIVYSAYSGSNLYRAIELEGGKKGRKWEWNYLQWNSPTLFFYSIVYSSKKKLSLFFFLLVYSLLRLLKWYNIRLLASRIIWDAIRYKVCVTLYLIYIYVFIVPYRLEDMSMRACM